MRYRAALMGASCPSYPNVSMNCSRPRSRKPEIRGLKFAATSLCKTSRLENESITPVAAGFSPRVSRLKLQLVQVLVDHAGADVSDLGAFDEPVDDERVQVLVVPHGHVNEEVLAAADDEDADRLRQLADPVAEPLDVAPGRGPDADGIADGRYLKG